ncbi:MAG: class I SAM-dependent methyltransferase [Candidatus Saccharimonadales bacterium]
MNGGGVAQEFKEFLPSGKVLEIGCGGGRDAATLVKLGFDYTGTDASAGMVGAAQQIVPHASFQQCDVYELAKLGRAFDGFWACAVLLHIPKSRIDEALQGIIGTVKQGAIGMISIKDGDSEEFEVRDIDGMHEERLFVYWKKDDFETVLSRNNLSVIQYKYRPVSKRTNWHIFIVRYNTKLLD